MSYSVELIGIPFSARIQHFQNAKISKILMRDILSSLERCPGSSYFNYLPPGKTI